jgi:hypothetical protein
LVLLSEGNYGHCQNLLPPYSLLSARLDLRSADSNNCSYRKEKAPPITGQEPYGSASEKQDNDCCRRIRSKDPI